MTLKVQDESRVDRQVPSEDVACMGLIAPVTDAMSAPEPQGNLKRPRLTPVALYPEVSTKPRTSIPAIVIPHMVSHRTATSPRYMIHDVS